MTAELDFTGERFVPGVPGEIVYEHVHRYAFARRFAVGRRVLDAACGEGYGSALLAHVAGHVTGVDLDVATIEHARSKYALPNLRFSASSVTALPLEAESVDLVVSFETIEHLPADDQPAMLAEFARVLAPDGLLLISSPNRPEYSERRDYRNPFHLHELDGDELRRALAVRFPAMRWFRQRMWLGSMLRAESSRGGAELWNGSSAGIVEADPLPAMYFVVLAARSEAALPSIETSYSLFADKEESELARRDNQDRLAAERLEANDRQTAHIEHLERLIGERDAELVRREARIAESQRALESTQAARVEAMAECERLERALAAQDRIIAHRQSMRWWLALPWLRMKLAWMQWRGR